jgi:hypothetical protein
MPAPHPIEFVVATKCAHVFQRVRCCHLQEMASAAAYDEHGNPVPQRRGADIFPGEYVKVGWWQLL